MNFTSANHSRDKLTKEEVSFLSLSLSLSLSCKSSSPAQLFFYPMESWTIAKKPQHPYKYTFILKKEKEKEKG